MKRSNFFSASRIVLAPIFFLLFFLPTWYGVPEKAIIILLIPLFIVLQLTDFFDGYYARKLNEVTDFGKHFDPFCDALANLTIFLCFMLSGYIPAILFLIIIYREFGITFLRMIAMKQGFVIPAKMGGKVKTVMYIVATGFSLLIKLFQAFFSLSEQTFTVLRWSNFVLYLIAVSLSVITFINYLSSYKKMLSEKESQQKPKNSK